MEKIPCIKCTPEIWEYIKPYLKEWGYELREPFGLDFYPLVVINECGTLGRCNNYQLFSKDEYNRELVTDVEEFLERAAHLKGRKYVKKNVVKINGIEIKPGMGIFIYDRLAENLHVVIPIKGGLGVIAYGASFTWYTLDDFLERYSSSIVAICDIPNSVIEGDILWEKPQEIVITMQDITEKFNCPVESIRN